MNTSTENIAASGIELFVSGRVCLFGEHTDWAATQGLHPGHCLVIGTDQGIGATARAAADVKIETLVPDELGRSSGQSRHIHCPGDLDALRAAAQDEDEFFRHCAGTAYRMMRRADVPGGIDLRIHAMDLPLGKGVSSSAAVCILVAQAFDAVYQLGMFPHELMVAAYRGERMTGSQCGMMDQACIYGKTPVLLTFQRSAEPRIEPVFPGGTIEMFIVDLAGQKDTVEILNALQSRYSYEESLQDALGGGNEAIVRRAYRALAAGDAQALGGLMTEAQALFDQSVAPHCPSQLRSPLLHELLGFSGIASHIHGGKGVGSQGDGTAQFVARSREDRDAAMAAIVQVYPKMQCFPLMIPVGPRGGA